MADNEIIYDTLASNQATAPTIPADISIVVTRAEFEALSDDFKVIQNYVNNTIKASLDEYTGGVAALAAHVHTAYPQSYAGVIPLHLDNTNLELFARRIHTHVKSDISDFAHVHPISHVTGLQGELNDKAAKTHIPVPASTAAVDTANDHDARYISRPELRAVGLFESAFICANGIAYNFNECISQGNWLFGSDKSHINAPPFKKGMLSVICTKTGVAANNDIYQIFYADNGNTYRRSYARINGQTTRTWSVWERVNGPYRIKSNTMENAGTACALNCTYHDIFNKTLDKTSCTITLSGVENGAHVFLYVYTPGGRKLIYNSVTLIDTEDNGTFRIEFQNNGTGVKCVNIMAMLA